ncbi:MAG: hypothetical protein OXC31_15000 [Spirochaetaceae bacterium]|nr:hypothetical protein [Spirochaetaceae bacterium]
MDTLAVLPKSILTWKKQTVGAVFDDLHAVVGSSAMTAENEGIQPLGRLTGFCRLLRQFEVATPFGLQRRPDRISTGQELMQAKREDRKTAGRILAERGSRDQPATQCGCALNRIDVDALPEFLGGAREAVDHSSLQPSRRLTKQLAASWLLADAEGRLDPRRE